MNSKHTVLFRLWVLGILASSPGFGQQAGLSRTVTPAATAPAAPAITILAASTGALIRSQTASNASLDLGRVSYFKGSSNPGETSQKRSKSFVVSTRFALRVDCPGSSAASKVDVTVARMDAASSHAITVDGITLGSSAQTLAQSMPCGSSGEHRLELEVPVSTPAGSIGSNVAFLATLKK